jgi:plasmid stabilization system protein ParE
MSGYVFHPQVFADLDEIWEYIAEDNLEAADRVIEDIHEAIQSLVQNPHKGHWRSDLASHALRFWQVHSYLIAYAPDESPLLVLGVLHGRRNPRILSSLLRARK